MRVNADKNHSKKTKLWLIQTERKKETVNDCGESDKRNWVVCEALVQFLFSQTEEYSAITY